MSVFSRAKAAINQDDEKLPAPTPSNTSTKVVLAVGLAAPEVPVGNDRVSDRLVSTDPAPPVAEVSVAGVGTTVIVDSSVVAVAGAGTGAGTGELSKDWCVV